MNYPFTTTKKFPLSTYPYKSRIHTQLSQDKGYAFVAFQPGYPLQGQELNEIQEMAAVQSTLNQSMTNFWCNSKIMNSGTTPVVYGPGWDGCTPLIPEMVGSLNPNIQISGAEPFSITVNPGWYLLRSTLDSNSNILGGLGVWVYYSGTKTLTGFARGAGSTQTLYAVAKIYQVKCVNSASESEVEDAGLRDFSSFNTINGPCGANRYSVKITDFTTVAGTIPAGSQVFSVMTITPSAATITFTYGNNYTVKSYP